MGAFVDRHLQWAAFVVVQRPFEWKWYYAFQQVGDQKAHVLSTVYTAGRWERDRRAGMLVFTAQRVLLERALQALARTDLNASLAYEARVPAFHTELRPVARFDGRLYGAYRRNCWDCNGSIYDRDRRLPGARRRRWIAKASFAFDRPHSAGQKRGIWTVRLKLSELSDSCAARPLHVVDRALVGTAAIRSHADGGSKR